MKNAEEFTIKSSPVSWFAIARRIFTAAMLFVAVRAGLRATFDISQFGFTAAHWATTAVAVLGAVSFERYLFAIDMFACVFDTTTPMLKAAIPEVEKLLADMKDVLKEAYDA